MTRPKQGEDIYAEKTTSGGVNQDFEPPPPKPKTRRQIEEEQEAEWKGPFGYNGGDDGFR